MLGEYVRRRLIEEMRTQGFVKYSEFAQKLNVPERWLRSKLLEFGRGGKRKLSLDDLSLFAERLKIPVCSLFPIEIGDVIRKMPIGEFLLSICKAEIEDRVRVEVEKYLKEHPVFKEAIEKKRKAGQIK